MTREPLDFATLIAKNLAGTADAPVLLLCNTTPHACTFSKRVITDPSQLSTFGSYCLNVYVDKQKQSWGLWVRWDDDENRYVVPHGPVSIQTHAVNMGLDWKVVPADVPDLFHDDVVRLSEEFRMQYPELYEQALQETA